MGLRMKFNLILGLVLLCSFIAIGILVNTVLQKHALEEIQHNAGMMMAGAMAVRKYTVAEVRPLLQEQMKSTFLPQTVPAYAASQNIKTMKETYPHYSYKEATINPTNPANRAVDWETDIINWFKSNSDKKELKGQRKTPIGDVFYLARPIQINNPKCLACHDKPVNAPKTLLDRYGNANGFGWKVGEIIGSQVVSVPMMIPLERASNALYTFMGSLFGIFAVVMLILNILLNKIVIQPVKKMAEIANEVSMGALNTEEFIVNGKDEIASLAKSFSRMQRSLGNAVKMIDRTMSKKADQTRMDQTRMDQSRVKK